MKNLLLISLLALAACQGSQGNPGPQGVPGQTIVTNVPVVIDADSDVANELENQGSIESLEHFTSDDKDDSKALGDELSKYQHQEPKSVFLFTHDGHNQFSIWRVNKKD